MKQATTETITDGQNADQLLYHRMKKLVNAASLFREDLNHSRQSVLPPDPFAYPWFSKGEWPFGLLARYLRQS